VKGHIFRLDGLGWTSVGPSVDLAINSLTVDPDAPSTIWAASDLGIWVTRDGGGSWSHLGPEVGIPNTVVNSVDVSPGTGLLVAFTFGRSAFVAPRRAGPCVPDDSSLCLNASRFRARVTWSAPDVRSGAGRAAWLSPDTGYFWFFDPRNVELVVKVLDGRPINGRFWASYGALSDVEYTLTVTDVVSGSSKTYHNPQHRIGSLIDVDAFR